MLPSLFLRTALCVSIALLCVTPAAAQSADAPSASEHPTVASPSTVNRVQVEIDGGVPMYRIARLGEPVVAPSPLGFLLEDAPDLDGPFAITAVDTSSFDNTWEQVWGEKQFIRNHYNELRITLTEQEAPGRDLVVTFRVYDDGVGFRYEFPEQEGLEQFRIADELTEFRLTGDHESWYIDAYQWNRFEYYFENTPLSEADTVHTPLTMRTNDDLYISMHEAALVDFSTMTLERTDSTTLKSNLMPWGEGDRVRVQDTRVSPWRTLQLADTPGGLITSYLILNLNEPNQLEDTSWIEPAKYNGIWWAMHLDKSTWSPGENLGATTENAKRYIDFAAEHGLEHTLVEGWNVGWDEEWYDSGKVFSFTESVDAFDLEEVAQYARDNGVRLMGHHETSAGVLHYEEQMEEAFQLYDDLGVRTVKMGYVGHDTEIERPGEDGETQNEWHHGQFMVNHHQEVTELAAEHQIMLNVHEGVKDTGLRRTYPNLMTREVAMGREYDAWGGAGGHPPEYTAQLPFTRSLAGPFDYTPGMVDLHFDEHKPDNRIKSTLAKEMALYITVYSPLHMLADLPENYEERPEALQFMTQVPTDWHDTEVLNASIGNYITIARQDRNSDDWYLGSITDEEGRVLSVPLGFLDADTPYVAEIYRDGTDAHWDDAPYDMVTEERLVANTTELTLRLAAGGGQVIRFCPATEEDVARLE